MITELELCRKREHKKKKRRGRRGAGLFVRIMSYKQDVERIVYFNKEAAIYKAQAELAQQRSIVGRIRTFYKTFIRRGKYHGT